MCIEPTIGGLPFQVSAAVLADPAGQASTVANFLNRPLDIARMQRVPNEQRYRNRADT